MPSLDEFEPGGDPIELRDRLAEVAIRSRGLDTQPELESEVERRAQVVEPGEVTQLDARHEMN